MVVVLIKLIEEVNPVGPSHYEGEYDTDRDVCRTRKKGRRDWDKHVLEIPPRVSRSRDGIAGPSTLSCKSLSLRKE